VLIGQGLSDGEQVSRCKGSAGQVVPTGVPRPSSISVGVWVERWLFVWVIGSFLVRRRLLALRHASMGSNGDSRV